MTGLAGRERISQASRGQELATTTHTTPSTMLLMLEYWEEVCTIQSCILAL